MGFVWLASTNLGAHLQLDDLDLACNYGRLISLVERIVEHLNGIGMKLVGKAGPLKRERHGLIIQCCECNEKKRSIVLDKEHNGGENERKSAVADNLIQLGTCSNPGHHHHRQRQH